MVLLLSMLAAAVAGVLALHRAQGASNRTVAADRLVLLCADARSAVLAVELERHKVLNGEGGDGGLRQQLAAGRELVAKASARSHGVHANMLATFDDYGANVLARHDEPADRLADQVLDGLTAEVDLHEQDAAAAQAALLRQIVTTQKGLLGLMLAVAIAGVVSTRGLSARRRKLEAVAEQRARESLHDPLTGLPNRAMLRQRLVAALAGLPAGDAGVALMWIDLDDFKSVNDTLGHETGDELLKVVAERLSAAMRPGDVVARFGGDEFVVLCERLPSTQSAVRLSQRLIRELRRPVVLPGSEHVVGASIGVVASPMPDATAMLSAADAAMYRAKQSGRGTVVLFDENMAEADRERTELALQVHQAADRGELRLHYQPLIDLPSGEVTGVEALIRWQHPTRGLLPPGAFLSLAEENGAVLSIGAWVIDAAARALAAWQTADDRQLRGLTMSVNLSAKQLADESAVAAVSAALARHGVDPALLCLEVTESAVMSDVVGAIGALHSLRALGVRIAIDDFGTGYSSLSYLKQFPVHELKLDRSFTAGVGTDARDSSIVAAVVNLCRAVDLKLVAEGVETPRQRDLLLALGCDLAQGYLWSEPLPADALARWIRGYRNSAVVGGTGSSSASVGPSRGGALTMTAPVAGVGGATVARSETA
ncbi:MAG: EAL domain-containing protein [Actinobacteria bacterium]|nr:EAL domain-containing protein [Actinomycetota bacterium]